MERPSTWTAWTAKLIPTYRITASTTTSATSRSSDAAECSLVAAPAACSSCAAMRLGDELSADPFELFPARIAQLQRPTVEAAAQLDWHAEARFDVGGDRAQLRRQVEMPPAPRTVGPHPVLGLP